MISGLHLSAVFDFAAVENVDCQAIHRWMRRQEGAGGRVGRVSRVAGALVELSTSGSHSRVYTGFPFLGHQQTILRIIILLSHLE